MNKKNNIIILNSKAVASRYVVVFVILFLILSGCSSYRVIKIETGQMAPTTKHGIYYSLPRTVLVFDVLVKKTEEIPGPFCKYAKQFLEINLASGGIEKPSIKWEIEDIEISSFAEPDPEEFYFIEPHPFLNFVKKLNLTLDESDCILGINDTKFETRDSEIVPPGKGSLELGIWKSELGTQNSELKFNYPFQQTLLKEKKDTTYIQSDTSEPKRMVITKLLVPKTTEEQARDALNQILTIRKKRFDLITAEDEIVFEKPALEFMVQELNRLEQDYINLFTGIRDVEYYRYRFIYTPSITDITTDLSKGEGGLKKHPILFVFSKDAGILTEQDTSGFPDDYYVRIKFEPLNLTSQLRKYIHQKALTKSGLEKPKKCGIYYRIPDFAIVKLLVGDKDNEIFSARCMIAQFGVITYLTVNKKFSIEFYENTGYIKDISE